MSIMADKAVSTEDLCGDDTPEERALGVARLEAILHTLVENKVESLKNESRRTQSLQSSPRKILNRLRLTSSPAITTRYSDQKNGNEESGNRARRKRKSRSSEDSRDNKPHRHRLKQEVSISSPESQRYHCRLRSCDYSSEEDRSRSLGGILPCEAICIDSNCPTCGPPPNCCCSEINGPVRMHFDDDYISLKIEGSGAPTVYEAGETDAIISEEALRRARRKRRRRRKRRMKRALAMGAYDPEAAVHLHDRRFKVLGEDEELPQPARWTIVATACLLLFMCLLLVGITLRMAPIIDDMVRKENEELLNSLQKGYNSTASVRSLS